MTFKRKLLVPVMGAYLRLIEKINTVLENSLARFNDFSYMTFVSGHFFLYWTFYWFLIRIFVRPLLLSFPLIQGFSEMFHPYIFTIIATIVFIGMAFIPTLITSTSFSIYKFIVWEHATLLYKNENWRDFVVTLVILESWIMYSKTRRVCSGLAIFIIFVTNFVSTGNFFLIWWLGFLYPFLYYTRVVYQIFPDFPRHKKLLMGLSGDLLTDSLDIYYGVKRPLYGIKPRNKRVKPTRGFHTSAVNFIGDSPGDSPGDPTSTSKKAPKSWLRNNSILKGVAQHTTDQVRNQNLYEKNFLVAEAKKAYLPNGVVGRLGGLDFVFPNEEAANLNRDVVTMVAENDLVGASNKAFKRFGGNSMARSVLLLGVTGVGLIGLLKGSTEVIDTVVAFQKSGAELMSILPDSWEWGSSVVSTETADAPASTSLPD
jgi:hypothetical protein